MKRVRLNSVHRVCTMNRDLSPEAGSLSEKKKKKKGKKQPEDRGLSWSTAAWGVGGILTEWSPGPRSPFGLDFVVLVYFNSNFKGISISWLPATTLPVLACVEDQNHDQAHKDNMVLH